MQRPQLPGLARALLKASIVSLGTTGLISAADAHQLLLLVGLDDA
jgi:hypothetical protein